HLVLLGTFQLTDWDTWWHLKQGELYTTTRSLPAQDPFSFTTGGREWVKFSWVADILFYLTFRAAGAAGLVLLRLLLLLLLALFLYVLLRACGLHAVAAAFLVFMASLALWFRFFVRPETLSYLLLLATMGILLRLRAAPAQAAYALLPVQVVWTNVHASFLFGIGLPGLVFLANLLPWEWCDPGWGRLRLDRARLRHLAVAVALLPIVGLLNPNGPAMLAFPFRQNAMARLTSFVEWKGVWLLPGLNPQWWEVLIVLGVLALAFFASGLFLLVREGRIDPVGWGIILSMGTYAFFRSRAIPYFVLALLPFLALALAQLADQVPPRGGASWRRWAAPAAAVACVLVLAASVADQALYRQRFPRGFGVRPNLFPEGASAFLERHRLDGRLFNAYQFGGYLIWRRWPANQVIIDGRYDAVLFDQDLFEAYMRAYRSPDTLNRLTAAYHVDILVLGVGRHSMHMGYIGEDPRWARVYWDNVAEVFVRRAGRHAALAAEGEYRLTRADPDPSYLAAYRADPATWSRAVGELKRAVAENPENAWAWLGLAQEMRAAGPAAVRDRLEALTHLVALLPAQPTTGELHSERAEVLLQLGSPDEAAAAARRALRLDGGLVQARRVLAAVAERRGDWAEARDQYRAILARVDAGNAEAPAIRARLDAAERALKGVGGR
ncbi:MAG TPA: hypothetical protein VED18_13220, partial [Candidatus Sulfotelmatobacter sp.]|nr:hypothetical protein [Candidatus Sulfotelmatobacter sp.]